MDTVDKLKDNNHKVWRFEENADRMWRAVCRTCVWASGHFYANPDAACGAFTAHRFTDGETHDRRGRK